MELRRYWYIFLAPLLGSRLPAPCAGNEKTGQRTAARYRYSRNPISVYSVLTQLLNGDLNSSGKPVIAGSEIGEVYGCVHNHSAGCAVHRDSNV